MTGRRSRSATTRATATRSTATPPALTSIFSGSSVFGQDLLDGKVFASGSLATRCRSSRAAPRMGPAGSVVTPNALGDWLDEHAITSVRTEGASLDGVVLGKHLSRAKFERSLPLGPALADLVFWWDLGGSAQLGWWADFRQPAIGDIHQRPDLSTIVASPNRPGMANVIVDHSTIDGAAAADLPTCRAAGRGRPALAARVRRDGCVRARIHAVPRLVRRGASQAVRDLSPMGTPLPSATRPTTRTTSHRSWTRWCVASREWASRGKRGATRLRPDRSS